MEFYESDFAKKNKHFLMEIHHSPYDSYGGDLLFAPQQIARDLLFLLGQIWLFNVYVAYVSCTPQVHCVCVLVIRMPYINRVT